MINEIPTNLLLAAILACYGLTYAITQKDGPADLLLKFRIALGGYDLAENNQPEKWTGRFITCGYCVGTWVGLLLLILLQYPSAQPLIYWWAIVGGHYVLYGYLVGG